MSVKITLSLYPHSLHHLTATEVLRPFILSTAAASNQHPPTQLTRSKIGGCLCFSYCSVYSARLPKQELHAFCSARTCHLYKVYRLYTICLLNTRPNRFFSTLRLSKKGIIFPFHTQDVKIDSLPSCRQFLITFDKPYNP